MKRSNYKSSKPKNVPRWTWKKPVGKPSRPMSAYNLFFKETRKSIMETKKTSGGFTCLARMVSTRWRNLPKLLKLPYEEQAVTEKKNYQKAIDIWQTDNTNGDTKTKSGAITCDAVHTIKEIPEFDMSSSNTNKKNYFTNPSVLVVLEGSKETNKFVVLHESGKISTVPPSNCIPVWSRGLPLDNTSCDMIGCSKGEKCVPALLPKPRNDFEVRLAGSSFADPYSMVNQFYEDTYFGKDNEDNGDRQVGIFDKNGEQEEVFVSSMGNQSNVWMPPSNLFSANANEYGRSPGVLSPESIDFLLSELDEDSISMLCSMGREAIRSDEQVFTAQM